MKSRNLFLILLGAGAGAGGMWLWNNPSQKTSAPDLTGLRAELDATAERGLPAPTLELPKLPTPISDQNSVPKANSSAPEPE